MLKIKKLFSIITLSFVFLLSTCGPSDSQKLSDEEISIKNFQNSFTVQKNILKDQEIDLQREGIKFNEDFTIDRMSYIKFIALEKKSMDFKDQNKIAKDYLVHAKKFISNYHFSDSRLKQIYSENEEIELQAKVQAVESIIYLSDWLSFIYQNRAQIVSTGLSLNTVLQQLAGYIW